MASAQVVKTSVANNSPSQDSNHPDDLFQSRNNINLYSYHYYYHVLNNFITVIIIITFPYNAWPLLHFQISKSPTLQLLVKIQNVKSTVSRQPSLTFSFSSFQVKQPAAMYPQDLNPIYQYVAPLNPLPQSYLINDKNTLLFKVMVILTVAGSR